jgi:hypothetical protein
MKSLGLLLLLALPLHAELRVRTDFEGGNAEVVKLDQSSRTLRIMPALHEGRGWPCWWFFKLEGLLPGDELTLEVQAQTKPFRDQSVLAAAWCQPRHAWVCRDGKTWIPTAAGQRGVDKAMIYRIEAGAGPLGVAWGPPFVPSEADRILAHLAATLPEATRFELAKTRDGRPVPGIRIGQTDAPHQVWVGARQHAWESGSSHVGRGFITWYAGAEAKAMRAKTCLYYIPIMDVDNAALGAGGKDAIPRDHNRDWGDDPIYPEVAAAQRMIRSIHQARGLDVFIDLHNPGSTDPFFFFGPFGFEHMTGIPRRNYQRWIELAAASIVEPIKVAPQYRFATYVKTEEERGRMSSGWVRANTGPATISVTLETAWNNPLMSEEGYGKVGAGLGRALMAYLATNPRRD